MAFGMSPFPLRFGSRQGGGGDPTAITPANADAFLASLGLTQAGTGATWGETGQAATPLYEVAAGKVPLAVETIGGQQYFGPIANPAGENLALHGADATNAAWSKNNIAPTQQTGSLNDAGAANGHSLLTATDANGTCLQAITSGSAARVTKFWLARETGSGTVEITQDNGSTWAAVSLTSNPQPFNIASATLANPTIGIRIVTSGDAVRLYRTQHQVASRLLRPSIGPTAGSTVTSGARSLLRTGMSGITEVDVEIASLIPPNTGSFLRTLWIGKASDNINKRIDINYSAGTLYVILNGTTALNQAMSADDPFKMRIQQSTTGGYSVTLNDGTPATGATNLATDIDALAIGTFQNGAVHGEQPILAIRCNLLTGLGGWNHSLLDNWS